MKLVVFDRDWADEFSPFGFGIMTEEEYQEWLAYYSQPQSWGFGTNEGYDEEVLADGCKVTDITQDEAEVLTRLFGLKKYEWTYLEAGLFPGKPDVED